MTIKEIRSHVRSHLAREMQNTGENSNASQWTDVEIDKYINEAYRQFLMDTEILRDSDDVTVTAGYGTLPDGLITLKRVEVGGVPIDRMKKNSYGGALPK